MTWSGCGRPRGGRRPGGGPGSGMCRCGCWRRRGWPGAKSRSRRWQAALAEAVAGRCAGVLVGGAAGVGKTALAEQLRPAVAARGGWFVAGKFDPFRRDLEFDAVNQALRALGRLLLAEPEEDLAAGPRADPGGGGAERGAAGRGGAGVRRAAGGAPRSGGSADRAGAGAAGGGGGAAGGGLAGPAGGGVRG